MHSMVKEDAVRHIRYLQGRGTEQAALSQETHSWKVLEEGQIVRTCWEESRNHQRTPLRVLKAWVQDWHDEHYHLCINRSVILACDTNTCH